VDVDPRWYEGFFERDWLDVIALKFPGERTQVEADFIVEKLELEPGARVLDLACGHGRHTIELARRGFRMTGLDLSPRSLDLARAASAEAGVGVEWVQADMREPPAGPFDAVMNLFTAFGYFEEEEENQRVLDAVARVLAPGGRFLIDVLNGPGLFGRYADRMWEEREGVLFLQEHAYDVLRGRNESVWTFLHPDGSKQEIRHSVRVYAPHELARMLESAGLSIDGSWGDWEGGELTRESRRLILRARKG
jgi:SAM-dependent methyltransferase